MREFILNAIWGTLAIYGLIEIIKVCIFTFQYKNVDENNEVDEYLENTRCEKDESIEKHL